MRWLRVHWHRFLGLLLLCVLLWKIDARQVFPLIGRVSLLPFAAALALNLPQIALKGLRWQQLLRAQRVSYEIRPAMLAYFGSIYIGLFTPGRLGEFVKALHLRRDCELSNAKALSSVVADRLFDLCFLLLVGVLALSSTLAGSKGAGPAIFLLVFLGLAVPVLAILGQPGLALAERLLAGLGHALPNVQSEESRLRQFRLGLQQLRWPWLLLATVLTLGAYGLFFVQSYLVALVVTIPVNFIQVSYAVSLGSLATLLPVSVSGLGTREAAIVAYLGTAGIPGEAALSFSLLVFVTFHVAGAVLGAVAWWLKPVPLGVMTDAAPVA